MTPLICHHAWFGAPMPERMAFWYQRLKDLNPDVDFRLWDEESMEALGLEFGDLARRFPSLAGVSNVVRLHAVHKHGGAYFDLDYEPIKPLDPLFSYNEAVAAQADGRLCNSYFQAPAGSPWVKWQIDNLHSIERLAAYAGVDHMSSAPREGLTILPSSWFYPFNFDTPKDQRFIHADTIMCHHWDASWLPKHS